MTNHNHTEHLTDAWKPSQFNAYVVNNDGSLFLYNSYVGVLARIPDGQTTLVKEALLHGLPGFPQGMFAELALNGFFVPTLTDELQLAAELHASQFDARNVLQLILMPNENCNFRCTYCYESFTRNKMKREVIEGVVEYVQSRIAELSLLRIGWFGGEPLTAPEIIEELSTRLQDL